MRYKITTRTQGAHGDPFLWVSDDFVMDGATVDDAIDKGRAAAIAKYPDAHIHLVYGAIPTAEVPRSVEIVGALEKRAMVQRPARGSKGKAA